MSSNVSIKQGGKKVELNQSHYKAAGGEGTVYVKGGYAYKIYHDPKKMIPVAKINELSKIGSPNVLAPLEPITDLHDQPVGFVMKYVDKTEFLCKLFTRGFRDANKVTPADVAALVHKAQKILQSIHDKKCLVVDYNPFNFLTNPTFDEYYHIDVDGYQTPSFKATALMDSVRDPLVKNNQFTENSDWWSWAVVMFELYTGTHPYKGRHPDFGKDWMERMKAGVSVFNPKATLPPNVQDWSVLPAGHKKWFERVFEHGERSKPPEPDVVSATAGMIVPQIIASTAKFDLTLVHQYAGDIESVRYINGIAYVYTNAGIYADKKLIRPHSPTGVTSKRMRHDFVAAQNDLPVIIEFNGITNKIRFTSFDRKLDTERDADGYFIANNRLYIVQKDTLVEYTFTNLGVKVIASQQIVANVFHTYTIFNGMVTQDVLGTCRISIPYGAGVASTMHVPELDRHRIIAGKCQRGIAVLIAESEGKFKRVTLCFDKAFKTYTARIDNDVDLQDIQLVVLDRGVAIATNEDTIELFADNAKVRVVDQSPITGNQRLVTDGTNIYVSNRKEIHQLKLK